MKKIHGTSNRSSSIASLLLLTVIGLLASSCNKHPGFQETESGIYKKLEQFGDCNPSLSEATFFIMDISYHSVENPDSGYHFQLHHHSLRSESEQEKHEGDLPGLRIMHELDSINCGDKITYIIPFSEINNCFLSAYADNSAYAIDEEIEFTVSLLKTFDSQGYRDYLMHASQQNEIGENEAIELLLMNEILTRYEKYGDCFIQHIIAGSGDSVKVGREIKIRYNTLLFNGKKLDETTEMQFNFGKPGQVIGGLQYGLSFLKEGDHALIYLPSYLAFGEEGSSSGIVPPHTPIYFDVKVLEVNAK